MSYCFNNTVTEVVRFSEGRKQLFRQGIFHHFLLDCSDSESQIKEPQPIPAFYLLQIDDDASSQKAYRSQTPVIPLPIECIR